MSSVARVRSGVISHTGSTVIKPSPIDCGQPFITGRLWYCDWVSHSAARSSGASWDAYSISPKSGSTGSPFQ